MKDLFAGISTSLKDRILNPVYVAFVFSWATINYRLILILISDGSAADKLSYIDAKLYPSGWWINGLLAPAGSALLLVIATPLLYHAAMVFIKSIERHTNNRILAIEGTKTVSSAEAQAQQQKHQEDRLKWRSEKADYLKEINDVEPLISTLKEERNSLSLKLGLTEKDLTTTKETLNTLRGVHELLASQIQASTAQIEAKTEEASITNEKLELAERSIRGMQDAIANLQALAISPPIVPNSSQTAFEMRQLRVSPDEFSLIQKLIDGPLSVAALDLKLGWKLDRTHSIIRALINKDMLVHDDSKNVASLTETGSRFFYYVMTAKHSA